MVVSLQPFAGVGVAQRQGEEAQSEGQHEDVQHELLLASWIGVSDLRAGTRIGLRRIKTTSIVFLLYPAELTPRG